MLLENLSADSGVCCSVGMPKKGLGSSDARMEKKSKSIPALLSRRFLSKLEFDGLSQRLFS